MPKTNGQAKPGFPFPTGLVVKKGFEYLSPSLPRSCPARYLIWSLPPYRFSRNEEICKNLFRHLLPASASFSSIGIAGIHNEVEKNLLLAGCGHP